MLPSLSLNKKNYKKTPIEFQNKMHYEIGKYSYLKKKYIQVDIYLYFYIYIYIYDFLNLKMRKRKRKKKRKENYYIYNIFITNFR